MDDDIIEYLLSIGALEFCNVNEDGDSMYKFTNKAKELVPDLYREHMKDFNAIVFSLWSKNFVDVVFDEDGEAMISINEKCFEAENYKELDNEEFSALLDILGAFEELEE